MGASRCAQPQLGQDNPFRPWRDLSLPEQPDAAERRGAERRGGDSAGRLLAAETDRGEVRQVRKNAATTLQDTQAPVRVLCQQHRTLDLRGNGLQTLLPG